MESNSSKSVLCIKAILNQINNSDWIWVDFHIPIVIYNSQLSLKYSWFMIEDNVPNIHKAWTEENVVRF